MHTKQYTNQHFQLSLQTDSDYFFEAVDSLLDFGEPIFSNPEPLAVSIEIMGKKVPSPQDQANYTYNHRICDNNRLEGSVSHPLSEIITDPWAKTIQGTISPLFKPDSFSQERLLDIALFQPLRYILSHHGYFFLHCAAIYNNAGGVLIAGPQNSGKSTIAVALLKHGFNFYCDDKMFLLDDPDNCLRILPLPTKVGIGNPGCPIWKPYLEKANLSPFGNKHRFSRYHLTEWPYPEIVRARSIVLPCYETKTTQGNVTEISNEDALGMILQENFHLPDQCLFTYSAEKQRNILHKLVYQSKTFLLHYNEENLETLVKKTAAMLQATNEPL